MALLDAARYRLRQFRHGLRATVSADERALVAALLPPAAAALFARQPIDAQRHSLDVLAHARREYTGYANHIDLSAAALLHDVGKLAASDANVPIGLWLRGPLVLLEALSPALLTYMADNRTASGWRYAAHVHMAHPAIGARWAAAAGCSPCCCWLIAHHQTPFDSLVDEDVPREWPLLLRALQAADNAH